MQIGAPVEATVEVTAKGTADREIMSGPMYAAARATGRTNLPDVDKLADFTIVSEAHQSL